MGGGDRFGGPIQLDPITAIRRAYARAIAPPDPTAAPSKPKTWADMTEEEKAEMRRLYEKKP